MKCREGGERKEEKILTLFSIIIGRRRIRRKEAGKAKKDRRERMVREGGREAKMKWSRKKGYADKRRRRQRCVEPVEAHGKKRKNKQMALYEQ